MDRKKILTNSIIYFSCLVGFLLWLVIGALYLTATTVSLRHVLPTRNIQGNGTGVRAQAPAVNNGIQSTTPGIPGAQTLTPPISKKEEVTMKPSVTIHSQILPASNTNKNGTAVAQDAVRGIPQKFVIPKLGVTATVEQVGLDSEGRMDIPKSFSTVAWYKLGYKVGQNGSAVLSGHYDTNTGAPAVFWNIGKLTAGDEVKVTDTTGQTYTYKVTEKKEYPYDSLPLQQIFATSGTSMLNMITCSGTWNRTSKNYSTRTVVYAKQI